MFDRDFYPTPKAVSKFLTAGLNRKIKGLVLEPSAGAGDLCDYLTSEIHTPEGFELSEYRRRVQFSFVEGKDLHVVELNPDLQATLRGKGYTVVGSDFLQFSPQYDYSAIIMNPPFSRAVDHVLHAWSLLEDGELRTVFPTAHFSHDSRKIALLNTLIDKHGSRKDIGAAFSSAEGDAKRNTDAEVSIVVLRKKPSDDGGFGVNFDDMPGSSGSGPDFDWQEYIAGNGLQKAGILESLEDSYNRMLVQGKAYFKQEQVLFNTGAGVVDTAQIVAKVQDSYYKDGEYTNTSREKDYKTVWNRFVRQVTASYWKYVIGRTDLQSVMTSHVRKEFNEFTAGNNLYPFTVDNVRNTLSYLLSMKDAILQKAVEGVFDDLRKYHEDNTCHWEGWKTNDAFKINKRVIVPYITRVSTWNDSRGKTRYNWYLNHGEQCRLLYDLDLAMCFVVGENPKENHNLGDALRRRFDVVKDIGPGDQFDNEVESRFFKLKFFKKGTTHITFKSQEELDKLNYAAAAAKKWLPTTKEEKRKPEEPAGSYSEGFDLTLFT